MAPLRAALSSLLCVLFFIFVSGCGGSNSGGSTPTPASPAIASLSPSSATAGSPAFTLTVTGSNFSPTSTVMWNGAARTTTFASASQLSAAIAAGDLAAAGTQSVTVTDSGRTSSAASFTVAVPANPSPSASSLSPSTLLAGSGAQTITVTGANFVSNASVLYNGAARAATFVSATTLTFGVAAGDLGSTGTATVAVQNPASASGGGGTSSSLTLSIVNPSPAISSITPATALASGNGFTLTVNGTGFVRSSMVRWNGSDRPTTLVSGTQLTAAISASDIASAGTATVSVVNPAPGGGTATATFTITQNPVPTVTGISPTQVTAGASAFALAVTGTNFIPGSTVLWNGSPRATTYVSPTNVTAAITAADVANAAGVSVAVQNPAPGGGTSNTIAFTVNAPPNPVPTLAMISPGGALAGDPAFTLTATGTNFVQGSQVLVNGSPRATSFVSSSSVTAAMLASDVANSGTLSITVNNPAPGGGVSNSLPFAVQTSPNPAPTVTSLSPSTANAGAAAFVMTISGTGFVQNSQVTWNGAPLATTFVSATSLTVQVPAADIAKVGTASVVVTNPQPGGGSSAASVFTITQPPNPTPSITSLSPSSASANSGAFTLTVNGTGFVSGSSVMWNGFARPTTFISATQLTAAIPATDIPTQGTAQVTVVSPTPGGGTSNAVTFTITAQVNPVPTIASLTPNTTAIRTSPLQITITGTGFMPSSQVWLNGYSSYQGTVSYQSSTTLLYTFATAQLSSVSTYQVSVYNYSPGGGQSNQVPFTVTAPVNPALSMTTVNLTANDIVWDSVHNTFYASTPSNAGSGRGNSIVPIATDGTIGTAVFAGSEPKLLRISDDCTYLYVQLTGSNQIKRFTLPDLTPDETLSFGVNSNNQPIVPIAFAVQPGHAHTLAVLEGLTTYSSGTVSIFDDAAPRSKTSASSYYFNNGAGYDTMVWNAAGSKLIVGQYYTYYLAVMNIDSTGVASTTNYQPTGYSSYGNGLHFDNGTGLVYDNLGHAVDPNTGTPQGVFQATGVMVPDSSISTAFFLGTTGTFNYTSLQLAAFDISHYTPNGTTTLYGNFGTPQRIVRWGTKGLAFNTTTNVYSNFTPAVYILSGSFVNPNVITERPFEGGTAMPQRSWDAPAGDGRGSSAAAPAASNPPKAEVQ